MQCIVYITFQIAVYCIQANYVQPNALYTPNFMYTFLYLHYIGGIVSGPVR